MKLGVISDVHGNRVALDAVFDDMPDVDGVVCAGDVVGYNPWPADCVRAVRERSIPTVMGNHDRAVASGSAFRFNAMARAGVEHARAELDDGALDWLSGLPDRRRVAGGRVATVHGHPDDPDRYTYPEEFGARMLDSAAAFDYDADADPFEPAGARRADGDPESVDLLVVGHTHVQGHETYDEGAVVNPGSVGQPRDGDPRAAYAVVDFDGDGPAVDERRVEYDVDAVADAVEAAGLPGRLAERLYEGR
ncbi:metallophosphoesterase family protein [Candidatus Halobonum tyrrellensis]|uniref:Phosphoesterase n=1 Tax=Candidatus Halobonum tyrrellensis G22 TaxID=1324957 RepID=V4GS63_9EURY|nr:metallophosphoesterase family protein [Candidatus Halobonum tyrrellensis]ESP87916.1 phosphoesterase [Candidatus Halobonum tyrrellensis G22]